MRPRVPGLVLCVMLMGAVGSASAAPAGWGDVPALVEAAVAPVADDLRACFTSPAPHLVGMYASRGAGDVTEVVMPLPPVGTRGLTPEERCLIRTVARIELPPLPASIDRVVLGYEVRAAGVAAPAPEAAFADWRDPAAALGPVLDAERARLGACDHKPRTVRLVVDLRRGKTRVWLPAWQFHDRTTGDGSTPAHERKVKTCLRRALRGWRLPVMPRRMPELQVAMPVAPAA